MVLSEFDRNCTLLIHRSHHHYVQPNTSVAATLVAAAATAGGAAGVTTQDSGGVYFPQQPQISDLQKRLEDSRDTVKLQALKEVILWVMQPGAGDLGTVAGVGGSGNVSGNNVASRLLMTIIRFVLPSTNHKVKKMLQLYWEIVDKTKPDGALKEEMILVCNKLREDLLHPNEYVRGSTLRLLCKIKFIKILEPLVEAVVQNLSHSHAYVRRNAVMCIFSMVRSFERGILIHAAEEIEKLLLVESDLSTKRNAFLMLINCDLDRAVKYALSVQDNISCLGDIFQLALLELLRKVSRDNPTQAANLLRVIVTLVDSCSPAVAYEGSSVLLQLSSSPVVLKAATRAYVRLLTRQGDNNVKLIVLDRLKDILSCQYRSALEEFVVDILRALSCPSMEVRKRALNIALKLITNRTVKDAVEVLKRELLKTLSTETQQQCDLSTVTAYQQLLIQAIRAACRDQLQAVQSTLSLLLDFLTDRNLVTATEVALLVRELIALKPDVRVSLIPKLCEFLSDIPHCRVTRMCLWIIGEYAETQELRSLAVTALFDALSPLPFAENEIIGTEKGDASGTAEDARSISPTTRTTAAAPERKLKMITRTIVLPDGTYGTEDVYEEEDDTSLQVTSTPEMKPVSKMRSLLLSGDHLLASTIAMTITKLAAKGSSVPGGELSQTDIARCFLLVGSLLKFCRQHSAGGETCDSAIRVNQAYRLMLTLVVPDRCPLPATLASWFPDSRTAVSEVFQVEKESAAYESDGFGKSVDLLSDMREDSRKDPDTQIFFRQLGGKEEVLATEGKTIPDSDQDLKTALGIEAQKEDRSLFELRLARVQQMTGLADPVYVEAFLQVNQFDLIVEFLVINRMSETLQNVTVELSTHGDLKIVERPATVTLAPGQLHTLHSSIKVQSTETGIIFGHVTFDKSSSVDKEYLVLHELPVDLLVWCSPLKAFSVFLPSTCYVQDFVQRSWIGESSFRTMWAEFEWENKIAINTSADVTTLLQQIISYTNMTVVGKYSSLGQQAPDHTPSRRDEPWKPSSVPSSSGKLTKEDYVAKICQLPGLRSLMENSVFFAVNLYSREDALANVSLEKLPDGKLSGHIRIRSRIQGVALSLGDMITVVQRRLNK